GRGQRPVPAVERDIRDVGRSGELEARLREHQAEPARLGEALQPPPELELQAPMVRLWGHFLRDPPIRVIFERRLPLGQLEELVQNGASLNRATRQPPFAPSSYDSPVR